MSIYRTERGGEAIRAFAEERFATWELDHTRSLLDSRLGPTHVLTVGEGPPLVLLPGTNFAAATCRELMGSLARTHRVHALDLPGQPGLSHQERPRGPDGYGRWLARLLPSLVDEPPVLVGVSLGAKLALEAACRGTAVAGLVLVVPAGLVRLRVTLEALKVTVPWLRDATPRTAAALLEMMMAPGHRPPAELAAWMALVGRHVRTSLAPSPVPAGALRALAGTPTVVVAGRHDSMLPPHRVAQATARKLPGSRVLVAEEAGHLLTHERPDAVAQAVNVHLSARQGWSVA